MKLKIILILIFLICITIIFGCDNLKCRPNAKFENKKGDWFAGFKCKGEF